MGGHLDLGDDGDIAVGRIFHDLSGVVLGQVTAVGAEIGGVGVAGSAFAPFLPGQFGTPGSVFCQPWVFLDFKTPAGSVGKVQVQTVDLQARQGVDLLEDEILVAVVA